MDSKHISKYDTLLPSPTRTVTPPAVTLVLRVVAGILAAFVFGLIAIIIIWSWWRSRTARVCAKPSSESRPDPDENTKVKGDEESVIGVPELANHTENLAMMRLDQHNSKLAILVAALKSAQGNPVIPGPPTTLAGPRKLLLTRLDSPLASFKIVDTFMLSRSATSYERTLLSWNRYIPRVPSPLGPGIRRGLGRTRTLPWKKADARNTHRAPSRQLFRYAARPGNRCSM